MALIGIEAFLSWVILGLLFSQFTSLIVSRYTERMKELGGKLGKHVASIKKVAVEDFQMAAEVVETEIYKPLIGSPDSTEIDPEAARRLSPDSKAGKEAYINYMQEGARLFRDAQNTQDGNLYLDAAAQFRAAASVLESYPEVAEVIDEPASPKLNEAYALINAGDQPAAIVPLKGFVERADSVGADQYTLLGQLYLTNDRAEDAIPVLEDGAHVYPNNSDIQSLLLNAYNAAGQTEQAIAAYRGQVQNDPSNPLYLYNLGSLLLNEERYDEAIQYLGRAVQQDPSSANAQYNYGAAHVNKAVAVNDEIATLEDSLRTNEQDLSDAEAQQLNSQVESLAEERTELLQDAISPLEHALELTEPSSPNRQGICRALFSAYVQTGQEEKAHEIQECAQMDVDL
jgi:tetratricopeptide (TPR) repeat protein